MIGSIPATRLDRLSRLRAALDPQSASYRTAVLLVAACEVGQAVHKLALVTGFPREFVARCARRLVDNGVWQEGRTVSPWTTSDSEDAAFWADVGVAEGRLYRRMTPEGNLEWAPPGQWWKEVHYVAAAGAYGAPTRYYAPSLPAAPDDSPHQFLAHDEEPVAEPRSPRVERRAWPEAVARQSHGPSAAPGVGEVVVVGSPALFGNAVWLT